MSALRANWSIGVSLTPVMGNASGATGLSYDLIYLGIFSVVAVTAKTSLFKRTL